MMNMLKILMLVSIVLIFLSIVFYREIGLGHDECGIILTSLNLDRWMTNRPDDWVQLNKAFISYSRGGLNIFWSWAVYKTAAEFGFVLSSPILVLPSTLLICAAGLATGQTVKSITGSSFWRFIAIAIFFSSPGITGYARTMPIHASMMLFLKTLFFLALFFAERRETKFLRAMVLAIAGLVVFSDNTYVVTAGEGFIFLGLINFFKYRGQGFISEFSKSIGNYIRNPWILIPIISIIAQVVVYKKNIEGGGMLFHNFHEIESGLYWHKSIFKAMTDQLGWGTSLLILPALAVLIHSVHQGRSANQSSFYCFAIIWCVLQFSFIFMRDWENSRSYLPLTAVPLSILISLSGYELGKHFRAMRAITGGAIASNLYGCYLFLFTAIPAIPRAYGEPDLHDVPNNYKAGGFILRGLGYTPENEATISPSVRTVSVPDGETPVDKPIFVPLFYFGTAPRNYVSIHTKYLVESDHPYRPIFQGDELSIRTLHANQGFCLKYVVQNKRRDVLRIYSRDCPSDSGEPISFDRTTLNKAFDKTYGNFHSLKTVDWLVK